MDTVKIRFGTKIFKVFYIVTQFIIQPVYVVKVKKDFFS